MFNNVREALQIALDDWQMMQQTSGDEGAEWAERFERHFYEFIDEFKKWYHQLKDKPGTLEDAEELQEVKEIEALLPTPLHLNFMTELDLIVDGIERTRFD